MKIKTISMGRTVNTGNYTSKRYNVTLELNVGDALKDAKRQCGILLDYLEQEDTPKGKTEAEIVVEKYLG